MKTENEINQVLLRVDTASKSKFPAMTYEQGVEEALQWVLGEIPDNEFSPCFD